MLLIALSIAVAPRHLRATRRAGWGLIAGGAVVTIAVGLTRRTLIGLADDAVVRGAVGETESAFLSSLGKWGAWVTAIGVVVLAVAIFALDALLTLVVAVAIALLVAYGIAQLLRLAGVGARQHQPA